MSTEVEPIDLAGLRRALAQLKAAGLSERDRVEFCADAISLAKSRRRPVRAPRVDRPGGDAPMGD